MHSGYEILRLEDDLEKAQQRRNYSMINQIERDQDDAAVDLFYELSVNGLFAVAYHAEYLSKNEAIKEYIHREFRL
jgi:hypothetical protein